MIVFHVCFLSFLKNLDLRDGAHPLTPWRKRLEAGRKTRPGILSSPSCTIRQEPVALVRPFRASLSAEASNRALRLPRQLPSGLWSAPLPSRRRVRRGISPRSYVRPRKRPAGTRSPNGPYHTPSRGFCQFPDAPAWALKAHEMGKGGDQPTQHQPKGSGQQEGQGRPAKTFGFLPDGPASGGTGPMEHGKHHDTQRCHPSPTFCTSSPWSMDSSPVSTKVPCAK